MSDDRWFFTGLNLHTKEGTYITQKDTLEERLKIKGCESLLGYQGFFRYGYSSFIVDFDIHGYFQAIREHLSRKYLDPYRCEGYQLVGVSLRLWYPELSFKRNYYIVRNFRNSMFERVPKSYGQQV